MKYKVITCIVGGILEIKEVVIDFLVVGVDSASFFFDSFFLVLFLQHSE